MSQEQHPCPLCEGPMYRHSTFPLYGHWICKRCYYRFANRRQLAFFIDIMILKIFSFFAYFVLFEVAASPGSSMSESDVAIISILIDMALIGLFLLKDCFRGQSPGKSLCGVKVIKVKSGQPGGIVTSFLRNFPLAVPYMAILANHIFYSSEFLHYLLLLANLLIVIIVGYQVVRGKRIGDGWASSKVIWMIYDDHPMFYSGNPLWEKSYEHKQSLSIPVDEIPHNKQSDSPPRITSNRIVRCPNCNIHVLPTSTGDCPSCQSRIR